MKRGNQAGFSLVELLIGISILAVLVGLAIFAYDGSKSKGQVLLSSMDEWGNGMMRMRTDTTCYPTRMDAMFDRTQAVATNSFCGLDLTPSWNGPYVKPTPVGAAGEILMDNLSPGLQLTVRRAAGGVGQRYFVRATNVPTEVITQVLLACNGADNTGAPRTGKCTSTVAAGAASGSVDLQFDETR